MVRNTTYARTLIKAFLDAHHDPWATGWSSCGSNEQLCLRSFLEDEHLNLKFEADGERGMLRAQHMLVLSGKRYNRNPALPCQLSAEKESDCSIQDVEIIHFMGPSKDEVGNFGVLLQQGTG